MKRIFLALFLLLLCVCAAVTENVLIEKSCDSVILALNEAKESLLNNDIENGRNQLSNAARLWEQKSRLLNVFLNTVEVEELERTVPVLFELTNAESTDPAIEGIEKSIATLNEIKKSIKMSLNNVLAIDFLFR